MKVHPEFPVTAHRKAQSVEIAEDVLEGNGVIVLELDGLLLAFLQHMCQLLPWSIHPFYETYDEATGWATQLEKVVVASAHDELVDMDLLAVVELDHQVGVRRLVEQVLELDVVVELHGECRRLLRVEVVARFEGTTKCRNLLSTFVRHLVTGDV